MNNIVAIAKANLIITVIVIVIALVALWYFWGKKKTTYTVEIEGEATQADLNTAMRLAQALDDDIDGFNAMGHNNAPYNELATTSDIVFAHTFAKYKELTGNNLTTDLNSEVWFGPIYDTVSNILTRATALNLV